MLGLLVERITRHRLADEIDHRLLRPLGLEGTGFPVHDPLIEGRHLHGYLPLDNSDGPYQDVAHLADFTVEFVDQTGAAGAIVSTTGDLLRFTRALLGGRLLPADLTAALSAPPAPLGDSGTVPGYVGEGLGVQVFDIDGRRMYGRTGLIRDTPPSCSPAPTAGGNWRWPPASILPHRPFSPPSWPWSRAFCRRGERLSG